MPFAPASRLGPYAIVGTLGKAAPGRGRSSASIEAYNLYRKDRYHWNKRTDDGLRKSIEAFEQSVAIDGTLALVRAGLGDNDSVFAWLERGCRGRELSLLALRVHPAYDTLRSEARFANLPAEMRFP